MRPGTRNADRIRFPEDLRISHMPEGREKSAPECRGVRFRDLGHETVAADWRRIPPNDRPVEPVDRTMAPGPKGRRKPATGPSSRSRGSGRRPTLRTPPAFPFPPPPRKWARDADHRPAPVSGVGNASKSCSADDQFASESPVPGADPVSAAAGRPSPRGVRAEAVCHREVALRPQGPNAIGLRKSPAGQRPLQGILWPSGQGRRATTSKGEGQGCPGRECGSPAMR